MSTKCIEIHKKTIKNQLQTSCYYFILSQTLTNKRLDYDHYECYRYFLSSATSLKLVIGRIVDKTFFSTSGVQ